MALVIIDFFKIYDNIKLVICFTKNKEVFMLDLKLLNAQTFYQFCNPCGETRQEINGSGLLECGHPYNIDGTVVGGLNLKREDAEELLNLREITKTRINPVEVPHKISSSSYPFLF